MCVANWDTDGDGELSYDEAAAVTDIGTTFRGAEITSFDEFEYFTGLTSISEYAFQSCYNLTSINIPNGVTTIGDVAFYGCFSLTNVTIPDGIIKFGISAFNGCFKLTTITIPDGTTEIGGYAFCDCVSLTNVIIPDSVTTIEYAAFDSCNSLTSVFIPDSVTSMGATVFEECSSLTIYCEAESKPSGWRTNWNYSNCPVVWGYKPATDVSAFEYTVVDGSAVTITKYIGEDTSFDRVEIYLRQHIGAPSVPCVSDGDLVKKGDKIADSAEGLSLPQYATIDGRVTVYDGVKIMIDKVAE
jgi:hypothetical protein